MCVHTYIYVYKCVPFCVYIDIYVCMFVHIYITPRL